MQNLPSKAPNEVSSRRNVAQAGKGSPTKDAGLIATALDIQQRDALSAKQVGYMASTIICASMPHSKVGGPYYKRDNGHTSVTMLVDPDIGLPYGKLPRLITAWVTKQAKLRRSPELLLGRSLSEFAQKLGLSVSGGKRGDASRLKSQATSLFNTFISVKRVKGEDLGFRNVAIVDQGMLFWRPRRPDEPSLWESTIVLSPAFYQHCMESAVPFDLRVLHHLHSSFAIDLYLWLTWRFFTLRGPTLVPWDRLRAQFGAGYPATSQGMAHFRAALRQCLRDVCALYPAAKLSAEKAGLRLYPSPPHVKVFGKVR